MTAADDVCGPIDFLMLTFDEARNDGRAAAALLALVDAGIIALYDVQVLHKDADGQTENRPLQGGPEALGGLGAFAGARSGLLSDDDLAEAVALMDPGSTAALFVYENSWARPFIAAALDADGHVLATSRIPAEAVIEALDALDAAI
jgi:uncharacterized membrane protein